MRHSKVPEGRIHENNLILKIRLQIFEFILCLFIFFNMGLTEQADCFLPLNVLLLGTIKQLFEAPTGIVDA